MVSQNPSSAVCPECGADVPKGALRCPDCRVRIDPPVPDTVVEQSLQRQVNAELGQGGISPLLKPPGAVGGGRIDSAGIPVVSAKLVRDPGRGGRDIAAQPTHVEKTPPLPQTPFTAQPSGPNTGESMADTAPPGPHPVKRKGGPGGPRTIGLVAVELEDALEAGVQSWSAMDLADHISMLASFGLIISTFLPWFGMQMGILTGGSVAWLFAVAAIALVILRQGRRRAAAAALEEEGSKLRFDPASIRRLNLLQILDGVGAVLYVLLVALGHYLGVKEGLKISYGWYIAIFLAMGLAYSGIARFARDARR
jgi:hypothetical protein